MVRDTQQLSLLDLLTAASPAQAAPPPAPPSPDLAGLLEDWDRKLAGQGVQRLPALPVRISRRANRSTMGSLRHRPDPQPHWALCLATSLLESDPDCALLLGRVLLLRVRRLPVPLEFKRALKSGQNRWLQATHAGTPDSPRFSGSIDQSADPHLTRILEQVAHRAGLGLPAAGLPVIRWQAFATGRVLGRYDERHHRIQIHLALRDSSVPDWALAALVYHEFLHALLGSELQGSRRVHHHSRFRRAEAEWPDHDRFVEWIRDQWPACHRRWQRRLARLANRK